jgi:16S rRNA (guanine527-N7)-methyltransferase
MTSVADALVALDLALAAAPTVEENINNFMALFQRWNRHINLSAARNEHELRGHVIDSLHVVPHVRAEAEAVSPRPMRVLDVGAGGGLPAVLVAICLPAAHITALEPVHKKHAFLRTAARELTLANLEPRAERVEHHQPPHPYDAALSRATFDLREWLLLGEGLVRPGGLVLGFEALPRADLPPDTQRHTYQLDGKSRAIVTRRHPA